MHNWQAAIHSTNSSRTTWVSVTPEIRLVLQKIKWATDLLHLIYVPNLKSPASSVTKNMTVFVQNIENGVIRGHSRSFRQCHHSPFHRMHISYSPLIETMHLYHTISKEEKGGDRHPAHLRSATTFQSRLHLLLSLNPSFCINNAP